MRIPPSTSTPLQPGAPSSTDRAKSPQEAAKKFEEVLARQFVEAMTKDLFKNNLAGEEGPAWMGSYSDTQRDILNDALAQHLVDQGTLGLSDLIMRKWNTTPSDGLQVPAGNTGLSTLKKLE